MSGGRLVDWIALLQTFGLPVVCLFALATAVWRALIFVGSNVLKPLAERHIAFIDKLQQVIEAQHAETSRLVAQNEKIAERMDEIAHSLTEVKSVVIKTQSVAIQKGNGNGAGANS